MKKGSDSGRLKATVARGVAAGHGTVKEAGTATRRVMIFDIETICGAIPAEKRLNASVFFH